jgi:hypothetical protein
VLEKRIERHITLRNPLVHKKMSERHMTLILRGAKEIH